MEVDVSDADNFHLEKVEIKQENVEIKSEYPTMDPPAVVKVERRDSESEKLINPLFVPVKVEPQDELEVLDSVSSQIEDINEVKASDYFVNTGDLVSIKREVCDDVKTELLSEECDLPAIKSESDLLDQPCSSKSLEIPDKSRTVKKKDVKKKKKKKRYPCPVCRKNFPSFGRRKKHIDFHFKTSYVTCAFCGKFSISKFAFSIHYVNHHVKKSKFRVRDGVKSRKQFRSEYVSSVMKCNSTEQNVKSTNKPYKCQTCSIEFKQESVFLKHLQIHTSEWKFYCDTCPNFFYQKNSIDSHILNVDTRTYKCEVCKRDLRKQIVLKNREMFPSEFECKFCNQTFDKKILLKNHVVTHGIHEREIDQSGIQPEKHNLEKPFKCEICSKSYSRNHFLEIHNRMQHTGSKSLKCDVCPRHFSSISSLNRHKTSHVGNNCEMCSKSFKSRLEMKQHLFVHIDEGKLECAVCLKVFKKRAHFNNHFPIHSTVQLKAIFK